MISAVFLEFSQEELEKMLEECHQMLKVEAGDIFS
jgi:hypothetical protein